MTDQRHTDEPAVVSSIALPPTDDDEKIPPTMIFQALQASNHSLPLQGKTFVSLVAHVASVEEWPGSVSFRLEDGTGQLLADKDLESVKNSTNPLKESEAERTEKSQYKAFEHTYAHIVGMLRVSLKKGRSQRRLKVKSIKQIQGYHQVMYHILNVMYTSLSISQQCNRPSSKFKQDFRPDEDVSDDDDDGPVHQDPAANQPSALTPLSPLIPIQPLSLTSLSPHPITPSTFTPQRHQPYANLQPLERVIMKYMRHLKGLQVSIAELAIAIRTLCGCTDSQFSLALQTLLVEAYLTSPLDDGYVIVTPRH